METSPTRASTAAVLRRTALRDFGPEPEPADPSATYGWVRRFTPDETPVPALFRYALDLVNLPSSGPGEKVAWWVTFAYQGFLCELAHRKFGVRLHLSSAVSADAAPAILEEISSKLFAAVKIVEPLLTEGARAILDAGDATVINQHYRLDRAYRYFRDRALDPTFVEDETTSETTEHGTWTSFKSGASAMSANAFHDLVAAITAYLSLLEHKFVLFLAFCDFNPSEDSITNLISSNWGAKWRRIVGVDDPTAVDLRRRLVEVVERWRNPYSHGGFEKGFGATIYLHTPGIGAVPIGLSGVRDSQRFSMFGVSDSEIVDVFELFDEIDRWMTATHSRALQWIESGLDVSYDQAFLEEFANPDITDEEFEVRFEYQHERVDRMANMDF